MIWLSYPSGKLLDPL